MVAGSRICYGRAFTFNNASGRGTLQCGTLVGSEMNTLRSMPGQTMARCALALLASAALLFFAAGGGLFHPHTGGPDTACHICQALHMPALAAARLDLISSTRIVIWYSSLPQHAAPSDSFSLHR